MIVFNGVCSDDLGIYVQPFPEQSIAERETKTVDIPGRDGKLYMPTGGYNDVKQKYQCLVMAGNSYEDAERAMVQWLTAPSGFARLEDDNDPYLYMLARFDGPMDIANRFRAAGRCDIEFIRRGKRYFKDGEAAVQINNGDSMENPTIYPSKPLIEIAGTGDVWFRFGDYVFEVTDIGSNIIIDTEREICYYGSTPKNSVVNLYSPSLEFPNLKSGETVIGWEGSGTVTSLAVTPRWWTL